MLSGRCTLVAEKNGSARFCVDYRHILNRHIVRTSWPLPNLESSLDGVGGVNFISTADVLGTFCQLPVAQEYTDRTAFVTPTGKFCFKRTPFGVSNASWLFHKRDVCHFLPPES